MKCRTKCRRRLRCRQERLSDEFGQPLFVRTAVSFGIRDSRRRKSCRAALSHHNGRNWGAAETGAGGAKAETETARSRNNTERERAETKTVRSRNNTERERAETETARGRNGIERERDEQKRPARHRRAADRRSAGMRRGFTAPRPAAAGCCRAPRANRPPALRAACP